MFTIHAFRLSYKLNWKLVYPFFVRRIFFEEQEWSKVFRINSNESVYLERTILPSLVHLSLNSWRIILVNSYRIHRFDTNFTVRIFPASQRSWRYIVTLTITTMGRRININRVCKSGETAQIWHLETRVPASSHGINVSDKIYTRRLLDGHISNESIVSNNISILHISYSLISFPVVRKHSK